MRTGFWTWIAPSPFSKKPKHCWIVWLRRRVEVLRSWKPPQTQGRSLAPCSLLLKDTAVGRPIDPFRTARDRTEAAPTFTSNAPLAQVLLPAAVLEHVEGFLGRFLLAIEVHSAYSVAVQPNQQAQSQPRVYLPVGDIARIANPADLERPYAGGDNTSMLGKDARTPNQLWGN